MAKNKGKEFESSIETSCKEQGIFYFRVRDVNLPPDVRMRVKLPQNKYDSLIFYKDHLFPVEMKSTQGKSFSFSESIIKQHQIDNLYDACKYEGVIPGFLFNFRNTEHNETFFVHIKDFVEYKYIAENDLKNNYNSKINKKSIPISICREIGVPLHSEKKRIKYRFYVDRLLDSLIEKFG